jgi:hypothetical protein
MRPVLVLLLTAGLAGAHETELEKIRRQLNEALERIDRMEKAAPTAEPGEALPEGDAGDLWSGSLGGGVTARLIDLSLDVMGTASWSTARNGEMQALNAHHHDPHVRGFTLQNAELSFEGAVDPYFTAESHMTWVITSEGEGEFELEEAFFTTTCLPAGFQVRGGHMNLEFGRMNRQHAHEWRFVNVPVVLTRFLGEDGLRSQGVELSWLAPLPFRLEATAGVSNARSGHGTFSFVFDEEENEPFPSIAVDREVRNWRDLLYNGRLAAGAPIGDAFENGFGVSYAHGPNSTGLRSDTDIFGADLYVRWTPTQHDEGWPFVEFQAEVLMRRYERGTADDGAGTEYRHEWFQDWGAYAQLVAGFARGWTAGLRAEWADGEIREEHPLHDRRWRFSPALTWHPTEFSRIRLQYDLDYASHLPHDRTEHQFSLQVEVRLGGHDDHEF